MSEPAETRPGRFTHLVHFYEDGALLLDEVERFIGEGLESGETAVVVAAEPHRDGLEERLIARGFDLVAARENGRYISLDAAETLLRFVRRGWPQVGLFRDVVGGAIARASEQVRSGRVRVFGEMVALLRAEGNGTAIRLERIWNQLAETMLFRSIAHIR